LTPGIATTTKTNLLWYVVTLSKFLMQHANFWVTVLNSSKAAEDKLLNILM